MRRDAVASNVLVTAKAGTQRLGGVSNLVVPAKAGTPRLSLRFRAIVAKTLGPRLRGDDAEAPLQRRLRRNDASRA